LGYHDWIGNRLRNIDGFRAGLMSTNHAGISLIEKAGLPDQLTAVLLKQGLHFLQNSVRRPGCYVVPAKKEATFLLDTDTLFKSVRNRLLERGKDPAVIVALWVIRPDPWSIGETLEHVPLQQCFHLLLELHAELFPVTLILSVDQKGSKQVNVLDVQPAAAAREQ